MTSSPRYFSKRRAVPRQRYHNALRQQLERERERVLALEAELVALRSGAGEGSLRSEAQLLAEQEERWRLAWEGSDDGVWDWNVITNEVFFSKRWKEMLGFEAHEIANHLDEWGKRVHPDDIGWVMEVIQEHFAGKTSFYRSEHRVLCKDGTYKWILDRGRALRNAEGQVVRMVGSHTDVTERRHLQDALQQATEQLERRVEERTAELRRAYQELTKSKELAQRQLAELQAIYAAAPVGLCFLDRQLRWVRINERLAEINGVSVANHIGRTVGEVLQQLGPTAEPLLQRIIETGEPMLGVEIIGETPAAPGVERVWIENFLPQRDESGQVIGINVVAEEVTERRQIAQAFARSEERYRSLVSVLTAIVWTADPDGHFIEPQEQWQAYTGQPWEVHQGFGWFEAVHPDNRELLLQHWQVARETRTLFRVEGCLWHAASGQYRHFEAVGLPLFEPDGSVREWIGTIVDVQERRQAEEEREQLLQRERAARDEAERASLVKDQFLALLSHELRTPLNPIIGWTQLLKRGGLSSDKQQQALEIIERNARLQNQLLADLLDINRIVQGKFEMQMRSCQLRPVVEAAVEGAQPLAAEAQLTLKVHFAVEDAPVLADPTRLQQVLWNLLSNAIKFTPAGGRVHVQLERVANALRLLVQDTGCGIDSEFLPHVFERFRQADGSTTRKYGGLGLGLFIVRHIVEAHSGTVVAESAGPGLGTTFKVELPLAVC